MGDLDRLCHERFSDLYGPLLHLSPRSEPVFRLLADTRADLDELRMLLSEGWRENLVGGVAALFHPDRDACRSLLWQAFDRGSWVTPQLAFCAMMPTPATSSKLAGGCCYAARSAMPTSTEPTRCGAMWCTARQPSTTST